MASRMTAVSQSKGSAAAKRNFTGCSCNRPAIGTDLAPEGHGHGAKGGTVILPLRGRSVGGNGPKATTAPFFRTSRAGTLLVGGGMPPSDNRGSVDPDGLFMVLLASMISYHLRTGTILTPNLNPLRIRIVPSDDCGL